MVQKTNYRNGFRNCLKSVSLTNCILKAIILLVIRNDPISRSRQPIVHQHVCLHEMQQEKPRKPRQKTHRMPKLRKQTPAIKTQNQEILMERTNQSTPPFFPLASKRVLKKR